MNLEDIVYLRREFRMWLALPATYNVIGANGIDVAELRTGETDEIVRLPVMRMPRMAGSLKDWIGTSEPGTEDRLVALAQAFNGLLYLYENGFEGHGDLKPDNILYCDLTERFELPERGPFPSREHKWQVKIADLGFADAWIDLGFTNKAFRQYLAPERLGDAAHVVPRQSDVFAMGVIASELLQGRHPAPNINQVLKSENKWKRWTEKREYILDGITSERILRLVRQCLDPVPADRPTPEECLHVICVEVHEAFGHDIELQLDVMRRPVADDSVSVNEHIASAAARSLILGPIDAQTSRENLESRIRAIQVCDIGSCESWVALASNLILLLEAEVPVSTSTIQQLRDQAYEHLRTVLGPIDGTQLVAPPRFGWETIPAFERLASVVGQLADIAGVTYDDMVAAPGGVGALALCAWAFSAASAARTARRNATTVERLLVAATQHAPEEPVPYYFRALWGYQDWFFANALETIEQEHPNDDDARRWIDDLDTACSLSPNWSEPRQLLETIRRAARLDL